MKFSPRHYLVILCIGLSIVLLSCATESPSHSSKATYYTERSPEELYKKHCKLCHGKDGQKMMMGAKDLSRSALSLAERITIISEGKSTMEAYKEKLSAEEISELATYIEVLRVGE